MVETALVSTMFELSGGAGVLDVAGSIVSGATLDDDSD